MRNAIRASVLILALCCPVSAGIVLTPPGVTTPTQPQSTVQEPTTDGQISTGATATTADGHIQNDAAATFVQVMLNLLALS